MNFTGRCKSITTHDTTPPSGSVRLQAESGQYIDIAIRSAEWLASFTVGEDYTVSITAAQS
jgi:hypothetical protein